MPSLLGSLCETRDVTVTCFFPHCGAVYARHGMWLLPVFALSVRGSVRNMGCDCYLFLPSRWGGLWETWDVTLSCFCPLCGAVCVRHETRLLPVFALSVGGSVWDTRRDCYLFLPSLWGGLCETRDVTVTCFCPLCDGVCERHGTWLLPVFAHSVGRSVWDTIRDFYLFLPSLWGGLCETWEATVWECTTPRSNIRMVGIRTRVKLISWEYQGHIKINTTAFKGHSDGNDSLTNGWKTMTHSNLGYHFCPNFRNSR